MNRGVKAGFFAAVLVIGACGGGGAGGTTTVTQATPTPKATPAPTPQAKVGDKVSSGNWEYTVTKAEKTKTLVWSQFGNKTDATGVWLIVSMTLKNIGNRNFGINTWDFELRDGSGAQYTTSSKLEAFAYIDYAKLASLGEQVPPGLEVKTALIFDINPEAKGLKLVLKQANNTTIALE